MGSSHSVFRDEQLLFQEYHPHEIPYRQAQLKELEQYFQGVVENPAAKGQIVLLVGPVGSGTLELAKELLESLPKKAVSYGNSVKALYINCRIESSLHAILVKAFRSLGQDYPHLGGNSEEPLTALVNQLESNRTHLIIALDEAGSLNTTDSSALKALTGSKGAKTGRLSLVLVSKTLDYLRSVDLHNLGLPQWRTVKLEPYTSEQLNDIMYSRRKAFNEGCLDDACIQLATGYAAQYGDIRYVLDLLYRAGKLADSSGSSRVLPEHVKAARTSLPP